MSEHLTCPRRLSPGRSVVIQDSSERRDPDIFPDGTMTIPQVWLSQSSSIDFHFDRLAGARQPGTLTRVPPWRFLGPDRSVQSTFPGAKLFEGCVSCVRGGEPCPRGLAGYVAQSAEKATLAAMEMVALMQSKYGCLRLSLKISVTYGWCSGRHRAVCFTAARVMGE